MIVGTEMQTFADKRISFFFVILLCLFLSLLKWNI